MAHSEISATPENSNTVFYLSGRKSKHSIIMYDEPQVIFCRLVEIEAEALEADLSNWQVVERIGDRAKNAFDDPRRISNVATHMDRFLNAIIRKMKDSVSCGGDVTLEINEMFYDLKKVAYAFDEAPADMMDYAIFRVRAFEGGEGASHE